MNVLMGAPNIVRGGSHSGNVAASKLASSACWISSRPTTTPPACWMRRSGSPTTRQPLYAAAGDSLVTKNPASALNLQDRGEIAEGKRADLVLAHRKGEHIHIDHVWRQGKRVF
jgi:alpha-D-ribose 1-methylphosphonate 5-triphosphate diphosphatase